MMNTAFLVLSTAAVSVAAVLIVAHRWKDQIMGAEQAAVNEITEQLGKASGEIVTKIDALEAQVAAGETPDFTALKAAAQGLDDLVPDAPVEPPVDETPAETPEPVVTEDPEDAEPSA